MPPGKLERIGDEGLLPAVPLEVPWLTAGVGELILAGRRRGDERDGVAWDMAEPR